jgi:DNA polymerase-3 subunit delta
MPPRAAHASPAAINAKMRIIVLHGPEEMLKRLHVESLRAALREKYGDLATLSFDGQSAGLADVLDELRTYGLLQPYKLVLVDRAEEFVKRFREPLERYAAAPVDQATLVLRSDGWHPGNIDKLIAKVGVVLKCEPLRRDAAEAWLLRRATEHHARTLAAPAARMMVARLGCDLSRLDSELAKLAALAAAGQPIEVELVEQLVGRSNDEKAWAVQDAVLHCLDPNTLATPQQRAQEMIRKVHDLVELAGHDETPVLWAIADLMRKLCYGVALRRQGESEFQIARALRFWGPQQASAMALLRKLDGRKAQRWYDRVLELDQRSKTGLGEPLRNLECFCALLADEL